MFLVPRLDLVLIETSLCHLFFGLQIQNCVYLCIFDHFIDVNLKKRIAANNNVVVSSCFYNFVEEESIEEGTISLFDPSVYNLNHVLDFVMSSGRDGRVSKLTFIEFWMFDIELTVWFPFFNLETTRSLLLKVRVRETSVVTLLELALAISMLVVQSHDTLPELDGLSVF